MNSGKFQSTALAIYAIKNYGPDAEKLNSYKAIARAMAWLESSRTANTQELGLAKDALWWAAMTYVVAALSALATLAYYVMVYMGRRD